LHSETVEEALAPFLADGLIAEILYPIKSGKEATVYCCRAGSHLDADLANGLVAAKVYKPRAFRAFKDDSLYREGRVILDSRARRAAARGTDFGQQVESALWTDHEWSILKLLYGAGADVPRPLGHSAGGLVLEFLGDEAGPAPVLKDSAIDANQAATMFERLLANIQLWLACNVVHGDLSAYNVLNVAGDAVVIDFPQALDPRANPHAFELLHRDIQNLARFFSRWGVACDAFGLAERYWSAWERP
jgi:RIO kinase 1